jgi:mutator protein MutT
MAEETKDGYKIVGVGIVQRAGKFLITQRKFSDHLGGIWEFPGGKKNPDESDEECISRELNEELGITVEVGTHIDTIRYSYPDRKLELRFYGCELKEGEPSPLEVEDFRWVKAAELIHFQFPRADRDLVERLVQGALDN